MYTSIMANNQELTFEWSMLDENYQNWTLDDLQLAAELGRTLLDRNEDLENELKAQQSIIDDQKQEIEFQMKQLNSMKEESLNRNKFYDQLETSVFELERSNSQLSRKHEVDKKRLQSMCENIEYLERKCEELSGTLESIRDTNKKQYNVNKLNRSSYFLQYTGLGAGLTGGGSSDSSEDDSGYFRTRRTQSLQDLRDYSSSPDELLDSNPSSSNSPDLKLSENEFIQSLETRIEELIAMKKKETDKLATLENQMKILIQENAALHQELTYTNKEKDEQLNELHKQLIEQSSSASITHRNGLIHNSITPTSNFSTPINGVNFAIGSITSPKFSPSLTPLSTTATKSQRNSFNYQSQLQLQQQSQSKTAVCKRCSEEINILSLVNSIEDDQLMNGDGEGGVGIGDDDEFSSLEFELARATNGYDEHTNLFIHDNHNTHNQHQSQNSILVLRKSNSSTSSAGASSNNITRRLSFDLQDGLFGPINNLFNNRNNYHGLDFNNGFGIGFGLDEFGNSNEVLSTFQSCPPIEEFQSLSNPDPEDEDKLDDDDDEYLAKDKSSEKYQENPDYFSLNNFFSSNRRLKLPEKIPVEFNRKSFDEELDLLEPQLEVERVNHEDENNSIDEFATELDTASCTLGIRKRSKVLAEIEEPIKNNSPIETATTAISSSTAVPEYKQILQSMFSLLRFGFTAASSMVDEKDEEHHIC